MWQKRAHCTLPSAHTGREARGIGASSTSIRRSCVKSAITANSSAAPRRAIVGGERVSASDYMGMADQFVDAGEKRCRGQAGQGEVPTCLDDDGVEYEAPHQATA